VEENWPERIAESKNIILKGKEAAEQINILGDDGVPLEYHDRFWKSELIDFVILQQDAFDKIDASTPMERQKYMLDLVLEICRAEPVFDSYEACAAHYKNLIYILRQLNYSEFKSEKFYEYEREVLDRK
jgi:V/A-type H+-transporting ATPase subunit A